MGTDGDAHNYDLKPGAYVKVYDSNNVLKGVHDFPKQRVSEAHLVQAVLEYFEAYEAERGCGNEWDSLRQLTKVYKAQR